MPPCGDARKQATDRKVLQSEYLWYGFTGTPIFDENKRAQKGDLPRTTAGMYGRPTDPNKKCLHAYTIKEAIGDGAVLRFKIEGMGFERSTLEDLACKLQIMNEEELEAGFRQGFGGCRCQGVRRTDGEEHLR